MTKNMVFIYRVVFFFFFFFMDNLALNDITLILRIDMDVDGSIEIWQTINFEEKSDRGTYLKFVQNLMTIFLKLKTQELNSNKIKI